MTELGFNLGFAVKRWPEPHAWAALLREQLGLGSAQFTYDLIDPWWPLELREPAAAAVRAACAEYEVDLHSAQVGFGWYSFPGLLAATPEERGVARAWWERAIDLAAEIGSRGAGGPVGAMSMASHSPEERERRFEELVEVFGSLQERAAERGLEMLLVEPTPVVREIPNEVSEAAALAEALEGGPVPLRYVVDNGHSDYRPLYGERAELGRWLEALAPHVGVLHLQNTDRQSDSHWGWPDPRAELDVAEWHRAVRAAGLDDIPTFLEVVYPFELDDAAVLENLRSTVEHCRAALAG